MGHSVRGMRREADKARGEAIRPRDAFRVSTG